MIDLFCIYFVTFYINNILVYTRFSALNESQTLGNPMELSVDFLGQNTELVVCLFPEDLQSRDQTHVYRISGGFTS